MDARQQKFAVNVRDATVETRGTAFEVSSQEGSLHESMAERFVRFLKSDEPLLVHSGERIHWQHRVCPKRETVEEATTAAWREDVMITDGLRGGGVTAFIHRCLAGPAIVLNAKLDDIVVSGRLDLSRQINGLGTLAATVEARAHVFSPLHALLRHLESQTFFSKFRVDRRCHSKGFKTLTGESGAIGMQRLRNTMLVGATGFYDDHCCVGSRSAFNTRASATITQGS